LDPRRLNPTLSVEFVDVLADMMAKNPSERIPTAAEVVARLAPWVGQPRPIPEAAGGRVAPPAKVFASTLQHRSAAGQLENLRDTQDIVAGVDDVPGQWQDEHRQRSQATLSLMGADDETRPVAPLEAEPSDQPRPRRLLAPLLVLVGLPLALVSVLAGFLWLAGLL
jgi:hypothetical protein